MLHTQKLLLAGLISIQLTALFAEPPFLGDSRPPRSIEVGKTAKITLQPGQSDAAEIVIAPDASKMTLFAAQELQSLLERKLGVKYPIVRTPSADKVSFILGINSWSKAAGIADSRLCRDAFIIKTAGKKIYIVGKDDPSFNQQASLNRASGWNFKYEKGTVFGVYDFLERFADAGFFFAGGGTVIEPGPVAIPDIDIYDRPDFEARSVQPFKGRHFLSDTPGKGIRERNLDHLRMRFQTNYVPCTHGLGNLGYWPRFGKTHPEYFAMDNQGRRVTGPRPGVWMPHYCYSSAVKEELYQDAKSCLLKEPAAKRGIRSIEGKRVEWSPTAQKPGSVFCAMPGDNFFRCQCPECKPFMKDNRTISDFFWGFVFDLAERLQKENIPGIVTNMSYTPYNLVPRGRKMPSNVYVMLACSGPWKNRYPDAQRKDMDLIREWIAFGGRKVWLWNYANKFSNAYPGIPHSTPKAVGTFYKNFAPLIFGAFMESETDFYQFNLINYYVFGKVAWNTQTDVEALLQDYCRKMFGPAAAPMRQFIDRVEELWMRKMLKEPVETPLGPVFGKASDLECWTKVYSAAERKNLTALFDQAEKLAANTPGPLARVKLFRKLFLDEILKHGAVYDGQVNGIPRFTADAAVLKDGEKITVDGVLDEPVWKNRGLYLQVVKSRKKPAAADRSRVMLAEDSENLYVAFDFAEPQMDKVKCPDRKDDDSNVWKDNGAEFFFDPGCSRKSYFQLILNSAGNVRAYFYPSVYAARVGKKWDVKLERAVKTDGKAWRGELRIPLADLKADKMDKMVFNVSRHQVREGEPEQYYSWSPFLNRSLVAMFHDPDNFGTVIFGAEPAANLLSDGDFLLPPQNKRARFGGKWFTSARPVPGVKVGYDENTFISGFRSVFLESEGKNASIRHDLPNLKPGTKYRISYFVKLENVQPKGKASGAVLNIAAGGNLWFPRKRLTGTIPWTYQEATFTTKPALGKNTYMLLYLMTASGKAWFDRIRLEEVK